MILEEKFQNLAHLHVHSEYSLADGSIRITDLVRRAQEFGHTSVALTDHANLFGAIEFYAEAKNKGLNPIIGAEIYYSGSQAMQTYLSENLTLKKKGLPKVFQMVLLAKNIEGYKNLVKIVSAGYQRGHSIPLVKLEEVESYCNELIAISSFNSGELSFLSQEIFKENQGGPKNISIENETFLAVSNELALIFGPTHFFVELCDHGLTQQQEEMHFLAKVAENFQINLVATANAHYLSAEDATTHQIALAIKNDFRLADLRDKLDGFEAHLLTNEEMVEKFSFCPSSLENISVICNQCNIEMSFGQYFLPKFVLDANETSDVGMRRLSTEGLLHRFKELRTRYGTSFDSAKEQTYQERLSYELDVIVNMGFSGYFLIVQDFINWAKAQGIPVGPGRGSGAGSLVAYALRITDIDPLPYNLIFERFLNPERVSMPDFDVDFCQERRDEVIEYVNKRYGKNHVAQITTFGKMMAKGALRDVGRVLGIGYNRVDKIAGLVPNEIGIKLKDAINQEPQFADQALANSEIRDLLFYAQQVEGLSRHTSVHAAGIVISDGPMSDYVPVYLNDDGSLITQFEMKNAEKVGLVKFDFLGLKTLTVIDKAVKLIRAKHDPQFKIEDIPLDDRRPYELISAGHSIGVFQLESPGMRQLLVKLKPDTFEDIIAQVALFRPGPLNSGMVDDFVERKHGRQKINYIIPQLEPILKETYGTIVYQEQVQKIASVLAKYSLGEADLLRRAMGKKKPEEMAKQKSRFLSGASENNIEPEIADAIFDLMAEFAQYGFNKSHTAAYGLISYQTAYLKAIYPAEFMAAIMTCDLDNTDKIIAYAEECRRLGLTLKAPSINESELVFKVTGDSALVFALAAIKGVGATSVRGLIEERNRDGRFLSLMNLAQRVKLSEVGKKTLELLAEAGALDEFHSSRTVLKMLAGPLVQYSESLFSAKSVGQRGLFEVEEASDPGFSEFSKDAEAISKEQKYRKSLLDSLRRERELLGIICSTHPFNPFLKEAKTLGSIPLDQLIQKVGEKQIVSVAIVMDSFERRTKDGRKLFVLRLDDGFTQLSPAIFLKPDQIVPEVPPLTPIVCSFRVVRGHDGKDPRVYLDSFEPLEKTRKKSLKKISISIKGDLENQGQLLSDLEELAEMFSKNANDSNKLIDLRLRFGKADLIVKGQGAFFEPTDEFFGKIYQINRDSPRIDVNYQY